ncbi:hypothetical protein I552_0719 [Mycobacterium xenopi 3993]|nr:hypothetical protein I552_0719 [Mycobacterium xenopi 3993]
MGTNLGSRSGRGPSARATNNDARSMDLSCTHHGKAGRAKPSDVV